MRLFLCRKLLDALYYFAALFFANFESWAPNIFQTPKQNIVMFCLDVWLCKHLSSADDDQPNKTKHVLFGLVYEPNSVPKVDLSSFMACCRQAIELLHSAN